MNKGVAFRLCITGCAVFLLNFSSSGQSLIKRLDSLFSITTSVGTYPFSDTLEIEPVDITDSLAGISREVISNIAQIDRDMFGSQIQEYSGSDSAFEVNTDTSLKISQVPLFDNGISNDDIDKFLFSSIHWESSLEMRMRDFRNDAASYIALKYLNVLSKHLQPHVWQNVSTKEVIAENLYKEALRRSVNEKLTDRVKIAGRQFIEDNDEVNYSIRFSRYSSLGDSLVFDVEGGTVISQNIHLEDLNASIIVRWDNLQSSAVVRPKITILNTATGEFGTLILFPPLSPHPVFPGDSLKASFCDANPRQKLRILPQFQETFTHQPLDKIIGEEKKGCPPVSRQWYVRDVLHPNLQLMLGEKIQGATDRDYDPLQLDKPWLIYYRVDEVISGVNGASGAPHVFLQTAYSVAKVKPIFPGIIAASKTVVPFNSQPLANYIYTLDPSSPVVGGYFPTGSTYQFTWEGSINEGPWQNIDINNFSVSSHSIYNVRIRRKVTIVRPPDVYSELHQQVPDFVYGYSNCLYFYPYYQTSDYENRNYVRTKNIKIKNVYTWIDADLLNSEECSTSTVYTDGFGNVEQRVDKAFMGDPISGWKDLVQPFFYDALGIQTVTYLPYLTNHSFGKFKSDPLTAQKSFYANLYGADESLYAFGKSELDKSPFNRVIKSYAPGKAWVGSNIFISSDYEVYNAQSEKIRKWAIGYEINAKPVSTEYYSQGFLLKNVTIDEQGKKVVAYINLAGQLILKKNQLAENPGQGHNGWLCTYYVYDDFGQLRYTITPSGVAEMNDEPGSGGNGWNVTQEIADGLCYYSFYDEKGRVILKKSADKGVEHFVYDQKDRLTFYQDGNMASKQNWMVRFHDGLDREVMSGIYKTGKTRQGIENDINNTVGAHVITLPGSPLPSHILIAQRDVSIYFYQSAETIEFTDDFENNHGDEFETQILPGGLSASKRITVNINPLPVISYSDGSFIPLAYKYYDGYSFSDRQPFNTNTKFAYSGGTIDAHISSNRTYGMPTGSSVRIIADDDYTDSRFLSTTVYYDEEGRVIQTLKQNIKDGVDFNAVQYNFDGLISSTYQLHSVPGSAYINFATLTKYTYDKTGRHTGIYKKYGNISQTMVPGNVFINSIEDRTADFKRIVTYDYDELGRLKQKLLGTASSHLNSEPLETVEYSYNIRGWMDGINKDFVLNPMASDKFFGIYLGYENADNRFNNARLNGNITGLQWRSRSDGIIKKFDFTYDISGRFTGAEYNQKEVTSGTWRHTDADFSVSNITYDPNGNLLSLTRMGILPSAPAPLEVDKLSYQYYSKTNKLRWVKDAAASTGTSSGNFIDGNNSNSDVNTDFDYVYDINGNMVTDLNKSIKNGTGPGIIWNYLDKPQKINIEERGYVEYVYDATGNKLLKKYTATPSSGGGASSSTLYINGFVYKEASGHISLQYIAHEEGKVRPVEPTAYNNVELSIDLPDNKKGIFDYDIKDHLTNVRAVITEEIKQDIYPAATLEESSVTLENSFYNIDVGNIKNTPSGITNTYLNNNGIPNPGDNAGAVSLKMYRLNGTGSGKTGLGIVLKVMAGDKIDIFGRSFYSDQNTSGSNNAVGLTELLLGLLSNPSAGGVAASHAGATAAELGGIPGVYTGILQLFSSQTPTGTRPKAGFNYIFFDEQFRFASGGFSSVKEDGGMKFEEHHSELQNITAPKCGYVYIFVSNESPVDVYFDNLQVVHTRGALLETADYYPFGLKIAALSSKAFDAPPNPYQYQGEYSEFDDETGWNEFELRSYDAQIGRWTGVDPYDEYASPYTGMGNDPVNNVDPSGGSIFSGNGLSLLNHLEIGIGAGIIGAFIGGKENAVQSFAWGFGAGVFGSYLNYGAIGGGLAGAGSWVGKQFSGGGWQNASILLAQSAFNGAGSGDDWVRNSNPQGIPVSDLANQSNNSLLSDLRSTIQTYTIGVMQDVGDAMVDHFGENTGTDFSNDVLNNHITASPEFQNKLDNTLQLIKRRILSVNGNLSLYGKPQNFSLPSFSKWNAGNPLSPNSLYTLIGGTQYGDITLVKYKYNARTKSFTGRIKTTIMDDFGVSATDVKKASNIPFSKGIRSMWYLQHVRGYKPFRNVYIRQFDIKF